MPVLHRVLEPVPVQDVGGDPLLIRAEVGEHEQPLAGELTQEPVDVVVARPERSARALRVGGPPGTSKPPSGGTGLSGRDPRTR